MTHGPCTLKEKILHLCREPISIDELSVQLSLSPQEVQEQLFPLQIDGLVEQDFVGMFQIT